jgi:hypothetical protein
MPGVAKKRKSDTKESTCTKEIKETTKKKVKKNESNTDFKIIVEFWYDKN